MSESIVLITGASTGFGRDLALALPKAGHVPVASMRDVEGRNAGAAAALREHGVLVVDIDVTDEESVQRGVDAAIRMTGRLDVLVNNAGFGLRGPLEAVTVDDLRTLYDVNVFGAHRMVRAVLPHMRERGSGLLIHISSGAGRYALPGSGAYCSSKWALEAMGETLRYELAPLGIDSILVEPGPYRTDFHTRSLTAASDSDRLGAYEHIAAAQEHRARTIELLDPAEVVDEIVRLIDVPRGSRPTRTPLPPVMAAVLAPELEAHSAAVRTALAMFGDESLLANGT